MSTSAARPAPPGRVGLAEEAGGALATAVLVTGVLSVVVGSAAIATLTVSGGWGLPGIREIPVDAAVGVAYGGAAVLVLAGSGGQRMALLLAVVGLAGAGTAGSAAVAAMAREESTGVTVAVVLQSWLWVPGFIPLLTLVPLLYPDGRLPSHRWRPVLVAGIGGMVLMAAGTALYPDPFLGRMRLEKPVTDRRVAEVLMIAAALVVVPACAASVVALVGRLRRSQGLVRRQVVVLLVSATVLVLDTLLQPVLPSPVGVVSQVLAVALVPVAIGVAVTRHRLYDLDLAVCRTISGASLAVCLAGVYLTVFVVADAVVPGHDAAGAALAAGVTGVLVHPLGVRLNRGVDRLFYGDRGEPEVLLARLASGLRSGMDLAEVPARVCGMVSESLRLDHVALVLGGDPSVAPVFETGPRSRGVETVPLEHRGSVVAVLVVEPRAGESHLDARDRDLLERVGDQVAPTIAALGLAERLQHARVALVAAREEERLRLRRDLHDGMGAALAGLRLQVEAARDLVADPDVCGLLDRAASGVAGAVDDLRGITDDLRPPALDDLGLAGCLATLAERLSTPATQVVARVDVPAGLPAAVDVACYRIAAEAMANAVRHAAAARVGLDLREVPGGVELTVSDDGHGLPRQVRSGALGLASMRQRAEEVGGSLELSSTGHGTTVRARLPVEET